MSDAILALNAGSSSVKFALYAVDGQNSLVAISRGGLEGIGVAPHFVARDPHGQILAENHWSETSAPDHDALFAHLLAWVDHHLGDNQLTGVGHRVVHGGLDYVAPIRLTDMIVSALERLTPLAPLHQPSSLAPIRTITKLRAGLPQVACFDTAFHATMPELARRLAIPRTLHDEGVRRYGFHGLSYEYIAQRLRSLDPAVASKRVVVAHLGNGASLCALRDGISIETTMGFTALDGLVMGTRCGLLDAGVLLYLLQQKKMSAHALEDLLYRKSGLLGVSGTSSDMRVLLDSHEAQAKQATDLFVYRLCGEIASLSAALGGLDGLVFTAGIGEHAPEIRAAVCARLGWLGIAAGPDTEGACETRISAPHSSVAVYVIPTDEEAIIGKHTHAVLEAR